jgi:hypothetical protein
VVTPVYTPFQINATAGLPIALDLYFLSPPSISADPLPVNLTGYTPTSVIVEASTSDEFPPALRSSAMTFTATLANQTGADKGKLQLRATGAVTAAAFNLGLRQGEMSVWMTSPGGVAELWDVGWIVFTGAIADPPADSESPTYTPRTIKRVLIEGPEGSEVVSDAVSVDFTATGATTIYTSASTGENVYRASIALTAVATLTEVPTIYFRRGSDSQRYNSNLKLTGMDTTGEARNIIFEGTVPTLGSGDTIQIVVQEAATAGTYTGDVRVALAT